MATLTLKKGAVSDRLTMLKKMGANAKQFALEQQQKAERQRKLNLAKEWLFQFPVFKQGKLLKIGIHKDLFKLYEMHRPDFGKSHLRAAMQAHVCSRPYRVQDKCGQRFDLNGASVHQSLGSITM